jgi:hypothetical protein
MFYGSFEDHVLLLSEPSKRFVPYLLSLALSRNQIVVIGEESW